MDKVPVTVNTLFLITRSCIDHRTMGEHGAPLIRDEKDVPVTFLALVVAERGVGSLPVFLVVIFVLEKVDKDVFGSVEGLGVKKIKGVVGGGKMAVHAVGHKSLGIIYMG